MINNCVILQQTRAGARDSSQAVDTWWTVDIGPITKEDTLIVFDFIL